MKVVIAGGRDYVFDADDFATLDLLHDIMQFTEVVSGKARGADTGGEEWAARNSVPVKGFPADWANEGRSAGHRRNERMARYADAVVLFPGGRGTDNMHTNARRYGLQIVDLRAMSA